MAGMDIEAEVIRRCREYLYPAAQDATDAEIMEHMDGTLFVASVRLNLARGQFAREVRRELSGTWQALRRRASWWRAP